MTPAKKAVPSLKDLTEDKGSIKEEETPEVQPVDEPVAPVEPEVQDDSPEFDRDEDYDDEEKDPFLSPEVVSTVPNKTPAELAAETPDETAARYGVDTTITDEDAENPRVQVYKDTPVIQVPSGTHLHPDIAKDLLNRGISQNTTDSAQVSRVVHGDYDFAPDAENNDKFQKPEPEPELDDEDYYEDVPPNAGSSS